MKMCSLIETDNFGKQFYGDIWAKNQNEKTEEQFMLNE